MQNFRKRSRPRNNQSMPKLANVDEKMKSFFNESRRNLMKDINGGLNDSDSDISTNLISTHDR